MAKYINASEFEKLTIQHYQFLIDEFGFIINKIGDWSFSLETENARVFLLVEHATLLTVAIEPIGKGASQLLRQNILPKGIEVVVISMCLDPNLHYSVAKLDNKGIAHDIPTEMKRRAVLLKKYCEKMLNGDFSDWGTIENCMSTRAYDFLGI